ncbi:MAG: hypothetical protein AAF630_00305 [Cyanobacteria bacterium P01_C01_bin.38]
MATTQKRLTQQNSFLSKYLTYSNCIILAFFILSFIGILNHEMWRDETQAWLIARDASTLTDLYENLKYEGHPGLWHLCLFFIAKFTHNPFAMQFFHILISTASVWIFVKLSPFNIVEKTLFAFSYFSLFEYNLISRNYNLGLLLIFLFCYLFTRKSRNLIGLFSVLALLANVNIYCLIICLCLTATLIIDSIRIHKNKLHQYKLSRKQISSLSIGLIILFLGIGICVFQLLPVAIQDTAKDIQQNIGQETVTSKFDLFLSLLKPLGYSVRAIWYSYIPIPKFTDYNFWSINIVKDSFILTLLASLMSLFLLFYSIVIFLDKPVVLFLYLSGSGGIILFTWLKYQGTLRHHGNLFILFLACIWISRLTSKSYDIPQKFKKITYSLKKYQKTVITVILLIQVLSGLYAYSMDLVFPFSKSKVASQFIQEKGLAGEFILGSRDTLISPVSAYLERKIYYIEYEQFGSFFNNHQRKYINSQSKLVEKIDAAIKNNSTKNVLILNFPLNIENSQLKFTKLNEFKGSIVAEEQFHIYLVEIN